MEVVGLVGMISPYGFGKYRFVYDMIGALHKKSEYIEFYIDTHYPGARILEIDKENGTTEIEIIDGNVCRELLFDRTDNWIQTKTETAYRDIPAIIQQAIANSIYASYRIDDIHVIQKAEGLSYEFELEQGDRDITILFNEEGILVSPTH